MKKLNRYSTKELALELQKRGDLINDQGLLTPELWGLLVALGAIPCVDSFAVRINTSGKTELLAIRRNTGQYTGKFCVVGGVIAMNESIEQAMRRHWTTDLQCEIELLTDWKHPFRMHQGIHPNNGGGIKEEFFPEPSKHSIAPIYAVKLVTEPAGFGSTIHGGQEASGFQWFTKENLPPAEEFAYGFHYIYAEYFESLRV